MIRTGPPSAATTGVASVSALIAAGLGEEVSAVSTGLVVAFESPGVCSDVPVLVVVGKLEVMGDVTGIDTSFRSPWPSVVLVVLFDVSRFSISTDTCGAAVFDVEPSPVLGAHAPAPSS